MTCGIYSIRNKISRRADNLGFKEYIGQSRNLETWEINRREWLNEGCHYTPSLQRAWGKYGPDAFEFLVIEELPEGVSLDELTAVEQEWLDFLKPWADDGNGYNHCRIAARPPSPIGRKKSLQTIERWRQKNVGRVRSQESRDRMSRAQTGKVLPKEVIEKIVRSNTGRKRSGIALENIRRSNQSSEKIARAIQTRSANLEVRSRNSKRASDFELRIIYICPQCQTEFTHGSYRSRYYAHSQRSCYICGLDLPDPRTLEGWKS